MHNIITGRFKQREIIIITLLSNSTPQSVFADSEGFITITMWKGEGLLKLKR